MKRDIAPRTGEGVTLSARLHPHTSPLEKRAIEILEGKKSQGFKVRHIIATALNALGSDGNVIVYDTNSELVGAITHNMKGLLAEQKRALLADFGLQLIQHLKSSGRITVNDHAENDEDTVMRGVSSYMDSIKDRVKTHIIDEDE